MSYVLTDFMSVRRGCAAGGFNDGALAIIYRRVTQPSWQHRVGGGISVTLWILRCIDVPMRYGRSATPAGTGDVVQVDLRSTETVLAGASATLAGQSLSTSDVCIGEVYVAVSGMKDAGDPRRGGCAAMAA